jgi:hypothetical protein
MQLTLEETQCMQRCHNLVSISKNRAHECSPTGQAAGAVRRKSLETRGLAAGTALAPHSGDPARM